MMVDKMRLRLSLFFVGSLFPYFTYFMTGIPISIVAASLRYQPARLATASRYLQSRFLFLFVAVMLHQLTCLTTERYLTITLKTRKITNHTAKNVAAICTAYVTATWLIIVIDDICDVTQTATIVSCSFVERISPAYRSSSKVTVAIISIWLTACNLTLGMTTASTLMYINNIMKDSKRRLGFSACRFEKRRLTIIYALNVIYGIIWIPYGVIVARRNKMDRRLAEILRVYFEISCYASFLTLPFVSYTTDKRFRAYIMSFSRKNATVNHKAIINRPNREGEPRSQNLVPRM